MSRLATIQRVSTKILDIVHVLKSLVIALFHISGEQKKVASAGYGRMKRRLRLMWGRGIMTLRARKLTLTIYGLFAVMSLKFTALTASLIGIYQASRLSMLVLDGGLIFLIASLIYLLGAIVHPLIRMERSDNQDVLEFGDDFGQMLSLRGAIESMPEAFAAWDKNKALLFSNHRFKEIYHIDGRPGDPGTRYADFEKTMNRLLIRHNSHRRGHDKSRYQAQMRDGRWLQISEQATIDGGLINVSFDVTKLKSTQQNLVIREQQMRSTLEDLTASRRELEGKTQKLAELADKYMREKDRAEEANRVKAEFLANISHELRTPLNAIIGFSDMMQREVLGKIENEQYQGYINDIHMSGSYLLELINDILDMSRIEAGRLKLDTKMCQLNELLSDCLNIITPQAVERDISICQNFENKIELQLDRRAIKQVMLNLMSNAIKFTPEGGEVEVSVEQDATAVHIFVRDSGIGIEKTALSKLGRPFVQVENQMTKCHSGTGLGLAISRSLIDLHGGVLTIDSEVGVGTTVLVTLPLKPPEGGVSHTTRDDKQPAGEDKMAA